MQHGGCCGSGSASGLALVRHYRGGVGREAGEAGVRRRCSREVGGLQRVEGRVFGPNVRRPSCRNHSESPAFNDVINSMT